MNSLYVVRSNPVPGREDEYNDWYTRRHLPEILTIPGFASAQRFVLSPPAGGGAEPPPSHSYLAIYEITADPSVAFAALARARTAGAISSSPALAAGFEAHLFAPITPRLLP